MHQEMGPMVPLTSEICQWEVSLERLTYVRQAFQPDPGYSAMVEGPTEGRKTIDCAAQRAAGTQPREGRLFRPSLGESR